MTNKLDYLKPNYVVCESTAALCYHIRSGKYQPCGKQTTLTLCGKEPAWDLKFKYAGGVRDVWCKDCMKLYNANSRSAEYKGKAPVVEPEAKKGWLQQIKDMIGGCHE